MGDNVEESKDDYKVPTKVGLNELMERDKDDAAMESYKKSLLGAAQYSRTTLEERMERNGRCVSVCITPNICFAILTSNATLRAPVRC